jgi:tRNA dimethylallyltransferase
MNPPHHPPAILLMGPTASGKTRLSAQLAQSLQCEVISVDSAQIYREMNIGTAKPDAEFLKQTPHHGIDIIDPHETYSAAKFRDDALVHMREITERGKIPLLVGGTMLYFKALIEGMNDLPEADPMVRLMIDTLAEEKGWPGVHANLMAVDPETAARLDPNDSQRIQRAMEIYHLTGKPMSEWLAKPKYVYFPYTPINIVITPSDRGVLHQRIATRFDEMLAAGLIDEVAHLREEYALEPTMPSMRCVGYRQTWQHLNGAFGRDELAKRQLTWLRGMEPGSVAEFDCLAADTETLVLDYIRHELEAQYLETEAEQPPSELKDMLL